MRSGATHRARDLGAFLAAEVDDAPAAGEAGRSATAPAVGEEGRSAATAPPPPRSRAVYAVAAAPAGATHGRSQFVELPAGRFHYLHWGRAGLPPAVLLHANCGSAATWARVGPALAGDYELFALDLRGHGASAAPGSYGLRAAADDVVGFFDALELDRPLLIGHSWGAAVALVVASGAESTAPPPRPCRPGARRSAASLSTDAQHGGLSACSRRSR